MVRVVQGGVVQPLVDVVSDGVSIEARRWATLALANISAELPNQMIVLADGALQPLYALSASRDKMTQFCKVTARLIH